MKRPRSAVILLAGAGRRLGVYTKKIPKCMVEVAGESLLMRLIRQLEKLGVQEAVLVVGYKAEFIQDEVGTSYGDVSISYVINEAWETTNNVVSLNLAVNYLNTDFFLIEGDLFFLDGILERLSEKNSMAVDHFRKGMNGTVVTVSKDYHVEKFYLKDTPDIPTDTSQLFKTVNVYSMAVDLFKEELAPRLNNLILNGKENAYYEQVFADAVDSGVLSMKIVKFGKREWCEIDTAEDLRKAHNQFGK